MSKEINKALITSETTFGVEIEMTGIKREVAANVAAVILNGTVEYIGGGYNTWICRDEHGRKWSFQSDCSIYDVDEHGNSRGHRSDYSCEMGTPALVYDKDMELLQDVVRALKNAGAVTGAQFGCGFHIHVSGKGHTAKTLKNFINLVYAQDVMCYKALNINPSRESQWCKKLSGTVVEAFKNVKTIEQAADAWYKTLNPYDSPSNRLQHYNSTRYHFLNLHRYFMTYGRPDNTIEIRAFDGTLHAGKIRAYVLFVLSMNASALTQKSIRSAKNPIMEAGNEKFAMRTWLNRMGWTGETFKNPHAHMIKNLTGDAAWRFGKNGDLYR